MTRTGVRQRHRLAPAVVLLVTTTGFAGCAPASPSPVPTPTPTPTIAPTATASPVSSPSAAVVPSAPPGTAYVLVPDAGVRLPVPEGWEAVDGSALADPAERTRLAATYPGADRLLAAVDELGGRAEPAFLAADPSAASLASPIATSLSVMVSHPSVGGLLLDFVAGFIRDGLGQALGAQDAPVQSRVQLPLGDAVRFDYAVPQPDGTEVVAVAWVIGAPAGTLLVTVIGTRAAVDTLDPGAIAEAIAPADAGAP